MIRMPKTVLALTFTGALLAGVAATANAAGAKPRYTNATTVTTACPVHWNYPKPGLPDHTWPAGPTTTTTVVGVRYTAGDYALVLDYGRTQFPAWGWINTSCLRDPVARRFPDGTTSDQDRRDAPDPDGFAPSLPNRQAVGGHNQIETVDVSPPHQSDPRTTLRFGSDGTLRSGPQQFVTGNVHQDWQFRITRDRCRTVTGAPYQPAQWVFGYAPQAGRWGWVQASHLPACTA
jgi:hypothetical protein